MRKLLYFFAFVLAIAGFSSVFFSNQQVYAEDEGITAVNLASVLADSEITTITLTNDIVLTEWSPIDFANKTLDGKGFTITTPAPLFLSVSNSNISNLGVIASESFTYDKTGVSTENSNFGLVACNSSATTFSSVYAEGIVEVSVASSTTIGGLVGSAIEGTIIENCYSKVRINATQNSAEALRTVVGGFAGTVDGSSIINSYAVPYDTTIISATVSSSLSVANTSLTVGGFVGLANKGSSSVISNNFCGGVISTSYLLEEKVQNIGKLFGEVRGQTTSSLCNNYTFTLGDLALIGLKNITYTETNLAVLSNGTFSTASNFGVPEDDQEYIWNEAYDWDLGTIWCKRATENYIILQVFQTFAVNINTAKNYVGVEIVVQVFNGETYETTTENFFPYNTELRISVKIQDEFLPYKNIETLQLKDAQTITASMSTDKKTATYDFVVNSETSGGYYATPEDIEYNIIVKSENSGYGKIKKNTSNISYPQITSTIKYLGKDVYVASPVDNSYAFDKWVWVASDGTEVSAYRGQTEASLPANQKITVDFGEDGTNTLYTYLTLAMENNILTSNTATPQDINGEITFTLEAKFTQNVCNLEIKTNLSLESCELYVSGILVENVIDYTSMFSSTIQVGKSIEIVIVAKEGFTFSAWETGSGRALTTYINETENETETSTTINLTVSDDFVLIANMIEDAAVATDLTWLWISLGGVGAVGLVILIVLLAKRHRKRESFIGYY